MKLIYSLNFEGVVCSAQLSKCSGWMPCNGNMRIKTAVHQLPRLPVSKKYALIMPGLSSVESMHYSSIYYCLSDISITAISMTMHIVSFNNLLLVFHVRVLHADLSDSI